MTVIHKTSSTEVDPARLEYVMSDATVDRYGDVIEPRGWRLDAFRANPIALFGHSGGFPVGKWKNVRVENGRLKGQLEFAKPGTSARIDEIRSLAEQGILKAVSVGFRPVPGKMKPIEGKGIRYEEAELAECSIVSIPANPNALQVAKSLHVSDETLAMVFGKPADEGRVIRRAIHGENADTSFVSRKTVMNVHVPISKRIEEGERELAALRDRLTDHVNKAEQDENHAEVETELTAQIETKAAELDRQRRTERALAIKSEPAGNGMIVSGDRPFAAPAKKLKPGDYVLRAIVGKTLAHIERKGVNEVLSERYGEDENTRLIANVVTKAAAVPATTTLSGWAAELVQTSIADFMEALLPMSVYPRLAAMGGSFTFGRNGVISIPSRAAAPSIGGSFVAQGAAIPVRQAAFSAITLTPKKMGVISTFTREIAEHSTPSIEGLIRQAIQEDTAVALDSVLLSASAASTTAPAGLRNGVTGGTPDAGADYDAFVADIKTLVGVLTAANSLRRPVWIMNPAQTLSISLMASPAGDTRFAEEIGRGTLVGFPVITSTSQTAGTVMLLDAADFVAATGDEPRFDVSDQATLHMEDTSPTGIVVGGAAAAGAVRSLWQTDTIGIRMLMDVNWAMRRAGVVAYTASVTW